MPVSRRPAFILSLLLLLQVMMAPSIMSRAWAAPIIDRDSTGRTIRLAAPAIRIISLAPSITEILFALGLDDEIIGVTRFCNYPAAARSKPKIGGVNTPSLEEIIRLKPDLILVIDDLSGINFVENLRRLDLPILSLTSNSIEQIVKDIRLIGRLTEREVDAEGVIGDMMVRIRQIEERVAGREPVPVLYSLWSDPLMTVGKKTFIGDLIRRAGGRLIGEASPLAYYQIGIETVLSKKPEVILIPIEEGDGGAEMQMRYWKRWPAIPAVKNDRVHPIDSDLVHRPGPRIVLGLQEFARRLHPEVFR